MRSEGTPAGAAGGLRAAGIVFGALACAQFARLVVQPEIRVAGKRLPLWPSCLALPALAALAGWMFRLADNQREN